MPWNFAFSWVYLSLSPFCFAFFFPQLFVKHLQRTILPSRISLCCWSVIKSRLTVTPWTAACQAPLSSIISWSLLKFMSIELMMLSNHLNLCSLLLLLLQSFPASRAFPVSRLFASCGQSVGVSALASVLSMNIQG